MTIEEEGKEIDLRLFMLQTPPPKQSLLMNAYTTKDCNDIIINVWDVAIMVRVAASLHQLVVVL